MKKKKKTQLKTKMSYSNSNGNLYPAHNFWQIPTPLFLSFLAFYLKDNENCGDLDTKCKL